MGARSKLVPAVTLVALALVATACLRVPAEAAGHRMGYAIDPTVLAADASYGNIVSNDASVVTPENHMKWGLIHPGVDTYDFERADEIVAFAEANGQEVRGHVLVWHSQLPQWITEGTWTRDALIEVMRDHIHAVVGHFRQEFPGVVTQWDVVNEAFNPDGSRRDTIFQQVIGDDYIELAFRFAREADPDVELFYNDFFDHIAVTLEAATQGLPAGVGANGARSDCAEVPRCVATRLLAESLLDAEAPIDGIGFQAHIWGNDPTDYLEFAGWTADLGLDWAITELDVALPAAGVTDAMIVAQRASFTKVIGACVTSTNCDTTVLWGVSDDQSWIPAFTGGLLDHGLLYGPDYQPKDALLDVWALLEAAV